jgi:hypothetical protein
MKHASVNVKENFLQEIMKKIHDLFFVKNNENPKQQNRNLKRKNSFYFFGDQSVFPEINSLQWDEYGNPFIYDGRK